jgi:hypothetical protein
MENVVTSAISTICRGEKFSCIRLRHTLRNTPGGRDLKREVTQRLLRRCQILGDAAVADPQQLILRHPDRPGQRRNIRWR